MVDERDQLAQLQDQMYHNMIEIPDELEQEIIDTAKNVATSMYFNASHKTKFEFHGKNYRAAYITRIIDSKKNILLIAFDMDRPEVAINAQAEINNDLSETENLRGVVAAFLRNRLGIQEAEELEE